VWLEAKDLDSGTDILGSNTRSSAILCMCHLRQGIFLSCASKFSSINGTRNSTHLISIMTVK
jgi:hypothetical protein